MLDINVRENNAWVISTAFDIVSARVIANILTHSSRVIRLRVLAHAAIIFLPVAIDPVKEIFDIPG